MIHDNGAGMAQFQSTSLYLHIILIPPDLTGIA